MTPYILFYGWMLFFAVVGAFLLFQGKSITSRVVGVMFLLPPVGLLLNVIIQTLLIMGGVI
jgi:hypothetical protein